MPSSKKKPARELRQEGSYYRCCIPALAGFVSPQSIAPDGEEISSHHRHAQLKNAAPISALLLPYLISRTGDLPLLAPHLSHRRALLWPGGVCASRFSLTTNGVATDALLRPCHGR